MNYGALAESSLGSAPFTTGDISIVVGYTSDSTMAITNKPVIAINTNAAISILRQREYGTFTSIHVAQITTPDTRVRASNNVLDIFDSTVKVSNTQQNVTDSSIGIANTLNRYVDTSVTALTQWSVAVTFDSQVNTHNKRSILSDVCISISRMRKSIADTLLVNHVLKQTRVDSKAHTANSIIRLRDLQSSIVNAITYYADSSVNSGNVVTVYADTQADIYNALYRLFDSASMISNTAQSAAGFDSLTRIANITTILTDSNTAISSAIQELFDTAVKSSIFKDMAYSTQVGAANILEVLVDTAMYSGSNVTYTFDAAGKISISVSINHDTDVDLLSAIFRWRNIIATLNESKIVITLH